MDVYEELVRLRNLGQKCALATIVQVRGSIPSYESAARKPLAAGAGPAKRCFTHA
jgi:xanthine/CO dehydrogenase XdhC/CoxF family maturation factor